jgi:hypothetical protein
MSLGDALLTFVSVFVAALLAFYLDGLRERRATRRWVQEYLGFWRGMLQGAAEERRAGEGMFGHIVTALDDWLAPGAAGRRGPDWTYVDAVNVNNSFQFTPQLLGDAVGVVPPELMREMFVADATAPAVRSTAEFVTRLFETEIRPLALARVVDLDAAQRRAVELYRAEFVRMYDLLRQYGDQLDRVLRDLTASGF